MLQNVIQPFCSQRSTDSTGLARILQELHCDSRLRSVVGEQATRTAQAYTWDRHACKAWEMLKEVASKKQA
jgi:hypothetical protein